MWAQPGFDWLVSYICWGGEHTAYSTPSRYVEMKFLIRWAQEYQENKKKSLKKSLSCFLTKWKILKCFPWLQMPVLIIDLRNYVSIFSNHNWQKRIIWLINIFSFVTKATEFMVYTWRKRVNFISKTLYNQRKS